MPFEIGKVGFGRISEGFGDPAVVSYLACCRAPSRKRSDVLNRAVRDTSARWHPAVAGLAAGLEILRDDCCAALLRWLPYQAVLVPMASLLAGDPA